jgi:hypothetical protein
MKGSPLPATVLMERSIAITLPAVIGVLARPRS